MRYAAQSCVVCCVCVLILSAGTCLKCVDVKVEEFGFNLCVDFGFELKTT